MKILHRMLVLLIAMTMLVSGSLVQVFANEEIDDDTAAVEVSEEAAESEDEAEAEEEVEEVVEVEEEVVEETPAEEPEEAEADESEAVDSIEDQVEEPVAVDEAEDEIFTAGTLTYECDDYTVTLDYSENSEIPEGTKLVVREISSDSDNAKEQKEYEEYYDKSLEQLRSEDGGDAIAKLGFARFYDITLVSDGKEIEPSDDVKVTFTYNKDSRESVKEGNNEDDAIRVIHMTESAKNGTIKAEPIEKKDTDLTLENKELKKAEFTAESFSVYGIVYTVDFEYEGYTYSIAGESEVMLSDLFSVLKIEDSAKDVENVEFTDYSLIKIEETDDDWKLTLLKPFDTEEKLTVTLEDKIIEIKVTDDASVARVSNDGGNNWTYHTNLVGTDGAFDKANTLSGNVTVELLIDSPDHYTLDEGFNFNNAAIISLTIKGTDNKSTLIKNQASAPMITTTGIEKVEFFDVIFDGKDKSTPSENGGAIKTDADELKVSNCEFIKCQAGYQGGGIYHNNTSGTATIKDSTFTGCRANGPDDNKGGGGGGAFSNAQSMTVTDCTFESCTTKARQGAGFFHKRVPGDSASSCTVTGCFFTDCESVHSGGGMESDAWNVEVISCTFTRCKTTSPSSKAKGGAFNVYADGAENSSANTSLTVDGCKFIECAAADLGGAVRSTTVTTTIKNSSFKSCSTSSMSGGAVACTNNNKETIVTDCKISDCHANKGNGGAIYTIGNIQISETSTGKTLIDGCSAKNGGAVYCTDKNAEIIVTGGTISNCHANDNGGAINTSGKIQISETAASKTLIDGCSAVNGGAIQSGELTMSGGTITGCSATAKGGAINGTAKITMTGGTITKNTTKGESAAVDTSHKNRPGFVFQGNVVIKDNTGASGEARDVYVGVNTDRQIQIDSPGLGDNASIGVYIADENRAFIDHGNQGQMFATTDNVLASDMTNLDKLFNDRIGNLHGAPAVSGINSKNRIMWAGGQQEVAPTNVDLRMLPYILILIGGAALVLIKKASDRRRKDEDDTDETEE